MILLLLAIGCGDDKGWETGQPEDTGETGQPDETADSGETGDTGQVCSGLDLVPTVGLLDQEGAACAPCEADQALTLVAALSNPCENEVGTRFTTQCDVSSWVITDAGGEEVFRLDLDCEVNDRLVTLDPGEALEATCEEPLRLAEGTYTLSATWDDAGESVSSATVEVVD